MKYEESLFAVGLGSVLFSVLMFFVLITVAIVGSLALVVLAVAGLFFLALSPFQLAWYVIKELKRGHS